MEMNTRTAILEALKEMDHRQAEKVLAFIRTLRPVSISRPRANDRFKGEALRQIQLALRANAIDPGI
jgi:hypothetical protein